jgi:hypothetical protein
MLARVLAQQAALAEFGSYAFDETDLAKVLLEAVRVCAHSLEAPFCKVCRFDPVSDTIMVVAGVGWNDGVIGHFESVDEHSPARQAMQSGKPVIIKNLGCRDDIVVPSIYRDHGIVSTVNVIIKGVANKPAYGVIEVDSPVQRDFDEYDIRFLTGFANVVAERISTVDTITLLRRALKEKDDLLRQKELLLQELHHRVRNNLQLVYGMLTDSVTDSTVIGQRVLALAQIYDHFVATPTPHHINFGSYLKALCHNVEKAFFEHMVAVDCNAASLVIGLDKASALGLATNELLLIRLQRQLSINGTIHVHLE